MVGRLPSRLTASALVALVVSLVVLLAPPGVARAADEGPRFGPALDWTTDGASAYADRLGTSPSVYAQSVHYPLTTQDVGFLDAFVQQASTQGAVALLTLEPQRALGDLTTADAAGLADHLAALHGDYGTRFQVRFAPEMNGSWTTWGQQPAAYVAAFQRVAAAVHARDTAAEMVWEPAYGAGYPFGGSRGLVQTAGPRQPTQMDTDGNGRVDAQDDPYAPYWPGAQAVDRVGLSIYWYGPIGALGTNAAAPSGTFASELAGTYGYASTGGPDRDFVQTYSVDASKPLLVETGALYVPSRDAGPGEQAVKSAWWSQVFAVSVRQAYPTLDTVVWLERARTEPEAGGALVDWRTTHTAELARAFRSALAADGARLGPVTAITDRTEANRASAQANGTTDDAGDQMGWTVACVVFLAVLLLASGLVGRYVRSWRYPDDGRPRDRRLDLFRGWIIVAVVVTHIEVAGPYSFVTLKAIGAITGAEMFVLLSGIVLGMVYPVALARLGTRAAVTAMVRRAFRLYLVTLGVVLVVFVLSKIPGIDTDVITTFTDRGTGAGGIAARGRVYDLYGTAPRLLDYPPPWYAVRDLLLVRIGPWAFNIMGLFVVLTLLVPPAVWLIRRRLWWVLLAASWGLYVLDAVHPVTLFGSQFEDVFPLLTWQVCFTHGLVIGYHRKAVTRALTGRVGLVVTTALVLAYSAFLGVLWIYHRAGVAPPLVPADLYDRLYDVMYQRTYLQPGRLIDLALMIVVAYAFLTAFWKPVSRAFGWFYEPLGQASLYVFVVHVFFVLAVGNIPHLDRTSWWQGTLVHTVVLALIWVMVRRKFLFRVIPS